MRDHIELYWRELAEVARKMPKAGIAAAADLLLDCQRRSSTIFVFGNGGSAATASHFACDLAKGTRTGALPTFRVVALNDNVPLLTAWGNDASFDYVFAEQLVALVRPGDVVVMISCSGNSPNVLRAAEAARSAGAITIALTGQTGGKLRRLADLVIKVPSPSIEQVEDAHLMVGHSLCVALRERLSAEHLRAAAVPLVLDEPISLEVGH